MARMKTGPKFALILILGIAAFFAIKYGIDHGVKNGSIPDVNRTPAVVPIKATLPDVKDVAASTPAPAATATNTPSNTVASVPAPSDTKKGPEVRFGIMAWNSQMGLCLANGGSNTMPGSLMAKRGVSNLHLVRQDDCNQMQTELISFATELSGGNPNPSKGYHLVAVMGDGSAAFLAALNPQLERLGADYKAEIIGSCGYSRGEDKFMAPPDVKADAQKARGLVIAGYLRDGDWNIALKWAADNGIANNPDETTWDPDAINWVGARDYLDAAEKYITGYKESRKVVKNGKLTGETVNIEVKGVVTWTPGDVNVARQRGGLVSIVSTKEYRSQMPNAIIGIKKWNEEHRPIIEGMLSAIFEAGDEVKSSQDALKRAAVASAAVYHEETPAYWAKYYQGVTEKDKQGIMVELGGSYANNLADNLQLYGLAEGSANLFAATYKVFGDIVVQQYPKLVPNYPSIDEVLNISFVNAVYRRSQEAAAAAPASTPLPQAEMPTFDLAAPVKQVVSSKSWNIKFETGKADFTSEAESTLDELLNQLLVAGGLAVEVHGHTDSVGNPESNMQLSEARAFAVKQWLEAKSPANFPEGRIRVFAHGQTNPIASNGTPEGRAQNRRVVITMGITQ